MYKLLLFCAVVAFPMIIASGDEEESNEVLEIEGRINLQIHNETEKIFGYRDEWYVDPFQITWNPVEIFNNAFLTEFCMHNKDGNYQNPTNCNQFFMCASGRVYLSTCPAGGYYAPIPDQCVFPSGPNKERCPWRSIWHYPGGLSCATPLGQRPYWGLITFPRNRDQRCGQDIYYCLKNKQIGVGKCAPGFSYCKCFLGCVSDKVCNRIDSKCS